METKIKSPEALAQGVLEAARELGKHQVAVLRKYRESANFWRTRGAEVKRIYNEAMRQHILAESRVNEIRSRLELLRFEMSEGSPADESAQEARYELESMRKHIFTIASNGDDQAMLSAARAYGDQCRVVAETSEAISCMEEEFQRVKEEESAAQQALKTATQKRDEATSLRAGLDNEFRALNSNMLFVPQFDKEYAMMRAICDLNGTDFQNWRIGSHGPFDPKVLPIVLPEDRAF